MSSAIGHDPACRRRTWRRGLAVRGPAGRGTSRQRSDACERPAGVFPRAGRQAAARASSPPLGATLWDGPRITARGDGVARVQHERSEPSAFERLVRDHARVMASAIRRVCGRRHAALVPDVEQEVYLALWKRLESGGEIRHPTSYVYKVALTTALAQVRRLGPAEPAAPEALEKRSAAAAVGFERLPRAERAHLLEEVLSGLDEEPQRALRAYLAGFNHVEIAELHGWSESKARHLVYRTLERIRRAAGEGDGSVGEGS